MSHFLGTEVSPDTIRAACAFAKLAKEFSDDPGSKDTGGEYTFPRGQMVKEFEQSAFSLQTNQVSDLVTTDFGYHIIKLSEKSPAKMLEFDKVAPDIKEFLKQREMQAHQKDFQLYIDKMKQAAAVTILDEKLKNKEPLADAPEAKPDYKQQNKYNAAPAA